jgi:hypothetical protein
MENAFQLRRRFAERGSRWFSAISCLALVALILMAGFGMVAFYSLSSASLNVGKWLVFLEEDASPCQIKGDIGLSGERLYYLPEERHYNETMIQARRGERWFCSEVEAQLQGWRRASG